LTRFYIINPIGDRRLEQRFESKESVVLRIPQTGKMGPATGYDIGRHGMRVETDLTLQPGMEVEVAFPNTPDHMRCFGRVVWARERAFGKYNECGISIDVWHGIIGGEGSWMTVKGATPKLERRRKLR
jgi:hypothetical protein